jgi:hypothetical protein
MTSIAESLAAVLQAEVDRRVAALQQLADCAINDMQQAISRASGAERLINGPQNATAASLQNTAVATPVVLQAPMQAPLAPLAGTQLAHDDPRLHGPGFEVTNSPIGLVRSGWIATGSSLPIIAGGN